MFLVIGVDFVHGSLHVHYDLPCRLNQISTLSSLPGEPSSWHVAVEPRDEGNGVLRIHTVVKERGETVVEATTLLPAGETAAITSENDGDKATLTLAPAFR